MPYNIRKEGDQFCIWNAQTGKKVADFDTRREAVAKMRALMAAEEKKPDASENNEEKD